MPGQYFNKSILFITQQSPSYSANILQSLDILHAAVNKKKHTIGILFMEDGVHQLDRHQTVMDQDILEKIKSIENLGLEAIAVDSYSLAHRQISEHSLVMPVAHWSKHDIREALQQYELVIQL
jgi:sulfur relay protein TusC/DsrF